MALLYSHSEWFVPSLQDLMDPNQTLIRRCVWHKSRRAPKKDGAHLVRCSNSIGEQDTRRADQLLEDLRKAPEGGRQYLKALRELASLSLCRNVHRSLNAEAISNFWVTEVAIRNPPPETPTQAPKQSTPKPSTHPIAFSEVLEQLRITVGARTKCHGRGQRGATCGNWINKSNVERIAAIARDLAGDWGFSNTVLKLLEELARLIMCPRWHQDQASLKLKDWTAIIKSKEAPQKPPQVAKTTASPQTPIRQSNRYSDVETPETKTSSLWTSPRRSQSPESTATTPNSSPSLGRTTKHSAIEIDLRQPKFDLDRQRLLASPTPVSRRTRSSAKNTLSGLTTLVDQSRTFEPFSTVKSPLKAAQYVMEKIMEKISKAEFAPGFVYGFRRSGCPLIKIGTTNKSVAERLRAIGTRCNYTPTVVFQVPTNHAMKVEHLVHRHLYRQNRRECLVNGLCNNGNGCPTRHKEWFEGASDTYAEDVVKAWVGWINLEPYDKDGYLKEAWVFQTKVFNLSDSGDIWMRWAKITLVEVKKEAKDESLDAAIKTEKVLSVLPGLSSQLFPPKPEFSVTTTEIRGDLSGLAAPVSVSSPVNVLA